MVCAFDAAFKPQGTETPMVMLHMALILTYPMGAAHGAPPWGCVGQQICQPPSCRLRCPSPDKTHQKLCLAKMQLLWILLAEEQQGFGKKQGCLL